MQIGKNKKKKSETKENKNTLKEKASKELVDVKEEKKYTLIAFYILAIFCISLFSIAIVPKTLQNDTFYTVKIGQLIRQNGIDYKDHFFLFYNLLYMY